MKTSWSNYLLKTASVGNGEKSHILHWAHLVLPLAFLESMTEDFLESEWNINGRAKEN